MTSAMVYSTQTGDLTAAEVARAEREKLRPLAERVIAAETGDWISFKIISDEAKYRYSLSRLEAVDSLILHWADGDEVEVWGWGERADSMRLRPGWLPGDLT